VSAQAVYCDSSSEMWFVLENLYSQQTIAESFQLNQQLRSTKKGSMSVNEYVLKIKTIRHALTAIGEPMSDKDLLLVVINGLDSDYEIVSLITYQMDEKNLEKVQYLLLLHEQRLSMQNLLNSFDGNISVNVASNWPLLRGHISLY